MVRIKCKNCGRVIVDTDSDYCNLMPYEEWDLTGDFGTRTVIDENGNIDVEVAGIEVKRYYMCMNCGHKIEADKFESIFKKR